MTEDRRKRRDRRRYSRKKKRLSVRFGPGDLAHTGYTGDVSDEGKSLAVVNFFAVNGHSEVREAVRPEGSPDTGMR